MMATSPTLQYYDKGAQAYCMSTFGVDMQAQRDRLCSKLFPGARVLDAGCGSGRDALAFSSAGFKVVAFDGSPAIAAQAQSLTGLPVRSLFFSDLEYVEEFDGVWASASLLHLEDVELFDAVRRLFRALKPGGMFYGSFKKGPGHRVDNLGRFFNDMEQPRLVGLIHAAKGDVLSVEEDLDKLGRGNDWISVVAQKP